MVNYTCLRCNYETYHKSVFKKHLLKKNTCPSKFNEASIYDILKLHGFDEEAAKYENVCVSAKIPPKYKNIFNVDFVPIFLQEKTL